MAIATALRLWIIISRDHGTEVLGPSEVQREKSVWEALALGKTDGSSLRRRCMVLGYGPS